MACLHKFVLVFIVSFFVAVPYVKLAIYRAPPGLPRLLLCTPLLAFNTAAWMVFDMHEEILGRMIIMFILWWLANFKLLALCLDRGALAGPWSMVQIAAILYQPIYPMPHRDLVKKKTDDAPSSGRLSDRAGSPQTLLGRWIIKTGIMAAIMYMLLVVDLSPFARSCMQALGLYCFVGFLMDGPASVITRFLGFEIIPTFDQPWMSTSLSDFWGRRWNITTSHVLRTLVHDPISEGCFVKRANSKAIRRSRVLRVLGLCATFLVSGIMHELILWSMQPDGRWHWKWFVFFTMQGPLMLAEHHIARRTGWKPDPWVARALTISFLMLMGHFLFFAPTNVDTNTAERVTIAANVAIRAVLNAWKGLVMNSAAQ